MSDDMDPNLAATPVSVVREIHVRPGKEHDFEAGMNRLVQEAARHSGHLGTTVVRPAMPGGAYRFLYKFDGRENLERWHDSEVREKLWQTVVPLIVSQHSDEYAGLETWFDFPASFTPPKWKTTLVSWLCIYPVALAVSYGMILTNFEAPNPIRIFVLTAIVVPVVAYLVAPRLSRLLHGWLNDGATNNASVKRYIPEQEGKR